MGLNSARTDIDRHPTHATDATRGVGLHRLRQDTGPPGELTLEGLRKRLDGVYDLGWSAGIWWGVPLFPGRLIEADTLEGLESAIRAQLARDAGGERLWSSN